MKGYDFWKPMEAQHFLFSLYPGDLVRVVAKKPINMKLKNKNAKGELELLRKEWLGYYVGANIFTASIAISTHDRKYVRDGIGVKTLLLLEKYQVDPLGSYQKVHLPEKRQDF